MILDESGAARTGDRVLDGDEDHRAGRSALGLDRFDARGAVDRLADAQRVAGEGESAACPHAPRQWHRREEVAALGMPVGADLGEPRRLEKEQPVPERRQRVAGNGIRIRLIQGGGQGAHWEGGDEILDGARATDPFTQLFQ